MVRSSPPNPKRPAATSNDVPVPPTPDRDESLAIEGRAARSRRARQRARQEATIAGVVAIAAVLLLAIGWRVASAHHAPNASARPSAESVVSTAIGGLGDVLPRAESATQSVPVAHRNPTPIFASYKSMLIRLPVPIDALTEVGFHQASYGYALPLKTPLPDANLAQAAKYQSTRRDLSKQLSGPNAYLVGSVVRMWRPRPGKPDTAADVGAAAGTVILSPVSGTVIKIKRYKLYAKWTDYEIHIQPAGRPKLDVVLIHIIDITTHVGDTVQAGITPLAHIRKLSDKFHDQLADYSKGPGDHVHIQVNDTTDPAYKGLVGAIDPTTWRPGAPTIGTDAAPAAGSSGPDDSGNTSGD